MQYVLTIILSLVWISLKGIFISVWYKVWYSSYKSVVQHLLARINKKVGDTPLASTCELNIMIIKPPTENYSKEIIIMKGKYLNLRSEIIRAGFTCYNVAEAIGISPQALSQKMNGYSLFSAEEIARIGRLLNINKDDYYTIFIEPVT